MHCADCLTGPSVLFVCLALFFLSGTARAVGFPSPPEGHPRLLLRPSDLPGLRERYGSDAMAEVSAALRERAGAASDGRLPDGVPENLWRDARRPAFEAKALLYLIGGDVDTGRQAIRMAIDYLASFTGTYKDSGLFVSRAANAGILGAAMVYDWCYPLLADEEKAEFVRQIERVAANTEYGWPIGRRPGFVTGHYGEEKHPSMLAAGIAVYDEDPSIYNAMADHLYNGFAPARDFFYPGHRHHQGNSYGPNRFSSEVLASFLITRMGLPNPCVADQGQVPYYYMYCRTPDGLLMVEGDDYDRAWSPNRHGCGEALQMLATMFGDPYVQDEALRYNSRIGDAAVRMLTWDASLAPRPVSELPLARYFGSPFGEIIARTGWDIGEGRDAGAVVAKMSIGEYLFGNHQHLDAGHFSLYYKGSLAIDSGVYQGTEGGYGCDHFVNYCQRTVAHNTVLVLDPEEPRPPYWGRPLASRDGGQFWPGTGRAEVGTIDEVIAERKRAEVLAHATGPEPAAPEYCYLKGDLAPGYQAPEPYPAKVRELQRSFVFLDLGADEHPAALIVFDRVTAGEPGFRKSWLVHSISEPNVEGPVTTITRTEDGYNGKLVNHTLLPRDCEIVKVGGPGREFWVDGHNYPQGYDRPGNHEPGAWRIEVSPAAPAETDLFLNVMQVMDAVGGPEPLASELMETSGLVGVAIADRVVLFSGSGDMLDGETVADIPGSGADLGILVTDVSPGRWRIEGPVTAEAEATPDGKALYFHGPAGTYHLRPAK